MTSGWHGVDQAVPLGRLLPAALVAAEADLTIEKEREIAPPFQQVAPIDGIRRQTGSAGVFKVVRASFEPDVRRILITDAALTPNANLDLRGAGVHLDGASVQRLWQVCRIECSLQRTELQSTTGSRRIWTRELLTLRPCKLGRQTALETKATPMSEPYGNEEPNLAASLDYQPRSATLQRPTAEVLPAAPPAALEQTRRLLEDGYQIPHLIGPRLKLQYGLLPLLHASNFVFSQKY